MTQLIIRQFRAKWYEWIPACLNFLCVGVVIGGLWNIGNSLYINYPERIHSFDNLIYVITPMIYIFSATYLLTSRHIITSLIDRQADEFQLWLTLGANPHQLALLVASQNSLIGLIVGSLGYMISYPLSELYINAVATVHDLSLMTVEFFWTSYVYAMLCIVLFIGIAAYSYALIYFYSGAKDVNHLVRKKSHNISRWFNRVIGYSLLILSLYISWQFLDEQPNIGTTIDSLFKAFEAMQYYVGAIPLVMVAIIFFLKDDLTTSLSAIFHWLLDPWLNATQYLALCKVLLDQKNLADIVFPATLGIFVVNYYACQFLVLIRELMVIANTPAWVVNHLFLAIFLTYLIGAVLVIGANLLTFIIINHLQDGSYFKQLATVGLTRREIRQVIFWEGNYYSLIILTMSLLLNSISYLIIHRVMSFYELPMINYARHALLVPFLLSISLWFFISIVYRCQQIK